jgi:hypothetical protein
MSSSEILTLGFEERFPITRTRTETKRARPRPATEIPDHEILAELERIVTSDDFPASERNRRVMRYVVQCTLEGRENEITAHHIATRVYGRPGNFDSLRDPIVRIEVARLRRDLETYYLKSGARNPLRIGIPKGRYWPEFRRAGSGGPDSAAGGGQVSPFLLSVLRTALCAAAGRHAEAAAAWQDLLLANPPELSDLQASIERATGDAEVTRLLVDGVLAAARPKP